MLIPINPSSPPVKPKLDPCPSQVLGYEPCESYTTTAFLISFPQSSLVSLPIRAQPAEWELDGPAITGPITSLKILCFINLSKIPLFFSSAAAFLIFLSGTTRTQIIGVNLFLLSHNRSLFRSHACHGKGGSSIA